MTQALLLQMSYDVALVPLIKEAVQEKWVDSATPTGQSLLVWLMDMQMSADFVTILFAICYEGKPTMEHGLGKHILLSSYSSTDIKFNALDYVIQYVMCYVII